MSFGVFISICRCFFGGLFCLIMVGTCGNRVPCAKIKRATEDPMRCWTWVCRNWPRRGLDTAAVLGEIKSSQLRASRSIDQLDFPEDKTWPADLQNVAKTRQNQAWRPKRSLHRYAVLPPHKLQVGSLREETMLISGRIASEC